MPSRSVNRVRLFECPIADGRAGRPQDKAGPTLMAMEVRHEGGSTANDAEGRIGGDLGKETDVSLVRAASSSEDTYRTTPGKAQRETAERALDEGGDLICSRVQDERLGAESVNLCAWHIPGADRGSLRSRRTWSSPGPSPVRCVDTFVQWTVSARMPDANYANGKGSAVRSS
jgi:hypothetical protein